MDASFHQDQEDQEIQTVGAVRVEYVVNRGLDHFGYHSIKQI